MTVIDPSSQGDLLKILTARERAFLARYIGVLRYMGGWGDLRLTFKDGRLVQIQFAGDARIQDEKNLPVVEN